MLDRHDELMRRELELFPGREVKTTGDGFLAVFDGPAHAVQCATAAVAAIRRSASSCTPACTPANASSAEKISAGSAVHIGARIAALAAPGEVLVSRTVTDLVAGSGLRFADHGEHELKGVQDRWHVYAVRV